MAEKDLPVKEESKVTIQRGKHDKENPYAMISKKMLRDKEISPKSKGVLCFLLSLPDNWKAHPRHVAESLGVSKDQIYTVLNELIKVGYATKTESKGEKGQFGYVNYEFYEEKLATPQILKEKSTVSGFPDTGSPDTGKPPLKNTDSIDHIPEGNNSSLKVPEENEVADAIAAKAAEEILKDSSKEKPKRTRTPAEFTPKVREIGEQLINVLVRNKPNYVPPRNLAPFLTHVDYLLRLDKRDAQLVVDVFSWAVADSFWADKMYKPNPAEYLRKQFDQFEMKMNAKPAPKDRKFAPSSNDARSLEKMQEWEKGAL